MFLYYSHIQVDPTTLIESVKASNNIFMGEMAICLILIIALIIVERYINRSDTKKVTSNQGIETGKETKKNYFSADEMFKRKSTNRSMTVGIKTFKTSDINMENDTVKNFFKDMEEDNAGGESSLEKIKITPQQKCKFYIHWVILIVSHVFVFWYIPISGNMTLYDTPECMDPDNKEYGCKSFHKNPFLRIFYVIILTFIMLSALQIKYGMPTSRKASSVGASDTFPAYIGAVAYMSIPFAVEVRCLIDYCFSETSLDNF